MSIDKTHWCRAFVDNGPAGQGVDTLTYVQTVRDYPEPALLLLPHDEAAFARLTAANSA
jgi:hypothetical protein